MNTTPISIERSDKSPSTRKRVSQSPITSKYFDHTKLNQYSFGKGRMKFMYGNERRNI